MTWNNTLQQIGYYCGRHGPGLWDEPQNSFSNAAFVVGAAIAYRMWRRQGSNDRFLLLLIALLACVGIGSFTFHSYPRPWTLYVDLVPIQIYALTVIAYVLVRLLHSSWRTALLIMLAFFVIRQIWVGIMPGRLLGGGITHVPTLAALVLLIVALARRRIAVWHALVAAALCYGAALAVRSFDMPLCDRNPLGLHWIWHLLTALAATLVAIGLVRHARPSIPKMNDAR